MEQRLNMLMLAVDDIERSRRFYEEGLGWRPWSHRESKTSLKYMASGVLITLIQRAYVSHESGLPFVSGTAGAVAVVNVRERSTAQVLEAEVVAAGGRVTSPGRNRDGGLYSFYFVDPDGNAWEVVWNPNMVMDESGVLQMTT